MAEMKYHDRLPHNYIDKEMKERIKNEIFQELKVLSQNVDELKKHHIPLKTIEDIKGVSSESVKSYIMGECYKFLQAASFIPNALENTTKMQYYNAYKDIEENAITVQDIIAKYSTIPLIYAEDGSLSYILEDVEKYATEKATIHITKEMRDKYLAYKELYSAFVKCHDIEKENGWRELSTQGYLAPFGKDLVPLSIWQILTGSYCGGDAQELTPERFIHSVTRFL